ncbi:MAG: hypothetical protein P8J33_06000 [Pirellulaceae bacterium]|nr:hypothetical protein [Pirellulaceae bacterium]
MKKASSFRALRTVTFAVAALAVTLFMTQQAEAQFYGGGYGYGGGYRHAPGGYYGGSGFRLSVGYGGINVGRQYNYRPNYYHHGRSHRDWNYRPVYYGQPRYGHRHHHHGYPRYRCR